MLRGPAEQTAGGVWLVDSGEEVDRLLPVLYSTPHPVGLDLEFTYVEKRHFLDHTRATVLTLAYVDESLGTHPAGCPLARRVFVPLFESDELLQLLKPWLEDETRPKVGHNIISADQHVLANHGIKLRGISGDTLRQSRMVYNSKDIKHDLKTNMQRELGYVVVDLETVLQRPKRGKPKTYKKTSYRMPGKTCPNQVKTLFCEGTVDQVSFVRKSKGQLVPNMEVIPQHEYWRDYPRQTFIDYASLDAKGTLELDFLQRARLAQRPARGGSSLALWDDFWRPYCLLVARTEAAGVSLCVDSCHRGAAAAELDIAAYDDELSAWMPESAETWNWNSNDDLKELLYQTWRLPRAPIKGTMRAIKPTKPGEWSVAEASLHWLQLKCLDNPERHRALDLIRKRKKANRLLGYLTSLPGFVHPDGRVHPMVAPSTDTGRLAAKLPPLQQIPGVKGDKYGIRRAFVAAPGKRLVVADYSQLEVYILAHYLIALEQDRSLADALATGDVYGAIAKQCWPDALAGIEPTAIKHHPDKAVSGWRDKSKVVLLAKNYCMSPQGMAISLLDETGTSVGLEVANSLMAAIDTSYPGIVSLQTRLGRMAAKHGGVYDIMGFWRPIPEAMSDLEWIRSAGFRKAANTPMQASAAKIVALAMLILDEKYPWISQLLQVHDEIIAEVDIDRGEEAARAVNECMIEAGNRVGLKLQLRAEVNTAGCWADGK